MTPKCSHGRYVDDRCARCIVWGRCYSEITEAQAELIVKLLDSGTLEQAATAVKYAHTGLKTLEEWHDAVQAHVDTYHAEYPQPEDMTFQRALEVVDGSCWANNTSYYLSALLYGNAWAWSEQGGGLLDEDDPLADLARFAFADAVYDAVKQLHEDREENA